MSLISFSTVCLFLFLIFFEIGKVTFQGKE